MTDAAGNEVVYIEQQVFRLLPEYKLYMKNGTAVTVKKEFTLFTPKFNIQCYFGELKADGDYFSHEFSIYSDTELLASVSKKWFSFRDSYTVDIYDEKIEPLLLALVIVIDQVIFDNRNQ